MLLVQPDAGGAGDAFEDQRRLALVLAAVGRDERSSAHRDGRTGRARAARPAAASRGLPAARRDAGSSRPGRCRRWPAPRPGSRRSTSPAARRRCDMEVNPGRDAANRSDSRRRATRRVVPKGRRLAEQAFAGMIFGAVGQNRTGDLLITNQLLYQLSYNSAERIIKHGGPLAALASAHQQKNAACRKMLACTGVHLLSSG